MRLDQWVDKQVEARNVTRKAVVEALAVKTGLHYATVAQTERGARMGLYAKAMMISEATEWAVSVIELCDPNPAETLARLRG